MKKKTNVYIMLIICMILCLSIAKETKATTTYYSASQVKVPKAKNGSPKYIKICKLSGNTVSYRTVTEVRSWDGVEYKYSKLKTAKLTSKTKYYIGNRKRFNYKSGKSWYTNPSRWIAKVSKSSFIKNYSKYASSAITIQNGKVIKIFTKIDVAG